MPVSATINSFGSILGVGNAERTLMAGFTTIRNLGANNFDDWRLRKAINDGWVVGPRMLTAGHRLGITGGHCDENGIQARACGRRLQDRYRRRCLNRSVPPCDIRSSTARM